MGGGTGGGYYLEVFVLVFVSCSLMSSPFFYSDLSMIAVVCVSLFFISFLCLRSLELGVTGA